MRACVEKLTVGIVYTIDFVGVSMKSFKDYAGESVASGESVGAEYLARQIATASQGKSNADMLKNILAQAEQSKRAGTLSNEELENFYQSFSPRLDSVQRKRLRAVVDRLKDI